jgi:hypothetical protein
MIRKFKQWWSRIPPISAQLVLQRIFFKNIFPYYRLLGACSFKTQRVSVIVFDMKFPCKMEVQACTN